jgi:redox-sensitive bicupin YhaK (pirin superfamily)
VIQLVIDPQRKDLGGFEVGRVLPHAQQRSVGPFVFLDHFGPAELRAGLSPSADVRPHPHIGLSTVSYLLDGEITHRDSVGSHQVIRAGDVNWMTAGRGITHSERFERARAEGLRLHGLQAWIALPEADEEGDPSFAHYAASQLPRVEESGFGARVLAGEAFGATSPVAVHSPTLYVHCEVDAGRAFAVPSGYSERALFVASGRIEVAGRAVDAGRLAILSPGQVLVTGVTAASVMLLGGEPLGRRFIEWNFVSSRRERIEQAKADWRAGRMKLPDLDRDEFIPLP